MKSFIFALLLLCTPVLARTTINAIEYGSPNAITLTNLLSAVGETAEVEIVLDGGTWYIGTNVTFATNVFVRFVPGTYMYISNGMTVTISGAVDTAWCLKFEGPGAGLVAGPYLTHVRIPRWWGTNGTVIYGASALGSGSGNTPHYISTTNMTNIVVVLENNGQGLTNRVINGTNFFSKTPQRLFWAYKNGNQVIGTTNTDITFSNIQYNTEGLYLTNQACFINLYTGTYFFAGGVVVSSATDQAIALEITTNRAPLVGKVGFGNMDGSGRENQPSILSPFVHFDSTGIQVRIRAKAENGGGCPATNGTFFSGFFLGN